MLSKLKSDNKIVGLKQVRRALHSKNIEAIYIAKDAEDKVTIKIIETCNEKHIPIFYVDTMKELGDACGIDVNAAFAALLK